MEKPKKKGKKILIIISLISLILALWGTFFGILPFLKIKADIFTLTQEVKGIPQGIQSQNLNFSIEKLVSSKKSLNKLSAEYKKLGWLKIIPYFGGFYKDGERLIKSGSYLLEAGEIAVEGIKSHADLLDLEGKLKEEISLEMTTEKRLMIALDALDKIQPNLDKISEKFKLADQEINQINPNRYPEKFFGKKVREKIFSLIRLVKNVAQTTEEIKPIINHLKPLLGFPTEKKYLLLFQNNAELRPTGGFITAYAIIAVNKGNFRPLGSFDIYDLDAKFGNRLKPPEPILNYHKNVFYWYLRDMNLSPDFKVSMETFWEHYQKVGFKEVDGIIAVDIEVLVDILEVLGPIGVAGWGNFSAENDKRCDCPQVFYKLEQQITKPVGTLRTERKAVLGPLMHSILLNIMQSPGKKWPEFSNIVFSNIREKHLLFYFFDQEIQKAIEALNAGGRIKDFAGDYLHVNDCNFAGAKSNMFIREFFEQTIEIAADGTVTKTLVIDYQNPAPFSNCNLEAGELCLNGLYRNWVRIYVPKGSELIVAEGSETEIKVYEDLGKTVFEAFYGDKSPLRPQGKAQLKFRYQLPFKIKQNDPYRLLIQKQPGTYGYGNLIRINGRQESFELKTDREFEW